MSGTLTHSPAHIIRQLIIDLGFGTLPSASGSWPVFALKTAATAPNNVITVYNTTANQDSRSMIDGEYTEHEGVMVRVRGESSVDVAYDKAQAILQGFDTSVNNTSVTVLSSVYTIYAITRAGSGVVNAGPEPDTARDLFTLNVFAALRQTT